MPNVLVGTVGGGTGLPTQRQCLDMISCSGPNSNFKLAEIIASVCASPLIYRLRPRKFLATKHSPLTNWDVIVQSRAWLTRLMMQHQLKNVKYMYILYWEILSLPSHNHIFHILISLFYTRSRFFFFFFFFLPTNALYKCYCSVKYYLKLWFISVGRVNTAQERAKSWKSEIHYFHFILRSG